MKKILITGAAGFIGYHLTKTLLKSGKLVYGIDNLNDYYDVQLKLDRLANLGIDIHAKDFVQSKLSSNTSGSFSFSAIDICDSNKLNDLFSHENFDIVINLAAQAGVRYSLKHPQAYIRSNLLGFSNVIEACRQYDIKHFIYASSSSVYGNQVKVPFEETDRTDQPVSLYAATKKANEMIAQTYADLHGLSITGLRFFTVYGPWGRPDMAPFLFTRAILQNEKIKVFNSGDLLRDFTYVDDVIDGDP